MKKSTIKIAGFMMLAMLLGGHNTASAQNFDLNGDGAVDVADMSALINYMAEKPQGAPFSFRKQEDAEKMRLSDSPYNEPQGVQTVDLQLPSGRLWADRNIGYNTSKGDPDYGAYFSWGGTVWVVAKGQNVPDGYVLETGIPYDEKVLAFNWKNYEHINPGGTTWRDVWKYTVQDGAEDAWWYSYGPYGNSEYRGDDKEVLEPEDDAAIFHWGKKGKWRMPYAHEIEELLDTANTIQTWKKGRMGGGKKDVWGCEFKSKRNGKTLFFPAAGDIEFQYVEYRELKDEFARFAKGKYWSKDHCGHFGHQPTSTAVSMSLNNKWCCEDEADNMISFYERQYGLSIRPVLGD